MPRRSSRASPRGRWRVGACAAGLATAVYGASEGLSIVVLEAVVFGGQAGASARIENYLGFPTGVSGQAPLRDLPRFPPVRRGAGADGPRVHAGAEVRGRAEPVHGGQAPGLRFGT